MDPAKSCLRQKLPYLQEITEASSLFRLTNAAESKVPEAAMLGFGPDSLDASEGVLIMSALGADPPEKSVHFHMQLGSLGDSGVVEVVRDAPTEAEVRALMAAAARLETDRLAIVAGQNLSHGLVWLAGSLDLQTHSLASVAGSEIARHLPEGDGEKMLKRFIEDSVDLLSGLELNRRRFDQGLAPLNLLWPWGQGLRPYVENQAIRRGISATIFSASMRLAGLARLAGYAHAPREWLGNGFNFDTDYLANQLFIKERSVVVLDSFTRLRAAERVEEGEWLWRELDGKLISKWALAPADEGRRLVLLFPSGFCQPEKPPIDAATGGLGIIFDPNRRESSTVPLDERALEESRLPQMNLWEIVNSELSC